MVNKEAMPGSERYYFLSQWGEAYTRNEVRCVFSDELCGYTFVPYSGSMKKIPEYAEKKAQFAEARIFLVKNTDRTFRRVPCSIAMEEKKVYLTEDNFNKYWREISGRIQKAPGEEREDGKAVTEKGRNRQIDLSLLVTPFRTAQVNENYVIEYKGIDPDIKVQRLISRRAAALDDNKIKYVFSIKDNLVHDKSCKAAEKISYEDFEASQILPENREMCPACRGKIYIREAIGDDSRHYAWYVRMFQRGRVSTTGLEEFLLHAGAKLYMEAPDTMLAKYREDTWKIKMDEQCRCKLYHNNYRMLSETEREIADGFHLQSRRPMWLPQALKYIQGYDWEEHIRLRSEAGKPEAKGEEKGEKKDDRERMPVKEKKRCRLWNAVKCVWKWMRKGV